MPLPQTYKSVLHYDREDFIPHFVKLVRSSNNIYFKEDEGSFELASEILFIKSACKFSIAFNNDEATIEFEVDAIPLLRAVVIVLMLLGLFSSFTTMLFLFYGALFSSIIYLVGLFFFVAQFKGFIRKFMINTEESLSPEQVSWMKDSSKCPACGSELQKYQSVCHSCGLECRPPQKFSPFSATKQNLKFTYTKKSIRN